MYERGELKQELRVEDGKILEWASVAKGIAAGVCFILVVFMIQ